MRAFFFTLTLSLSKGELVEGEGQHHNAANKQSQGAHACRTS